MSEMVERVARDINMMIANLAQPVGMGIGLPELAAKAVAAIAISAMREPHGRRGEMMPPPKLPPAIAEMVSR